MTSAKIRTVSAAILTTTLLFVGCGDGSSGGGGLVGTWAWLSAVIDGMTLPASIPDDTDLIDAATPGGSTTINMAFIQGIGADRDTTISGTLSITFGSDLSVTISYDFTSVPTEGDASTFRGNVLGTYTVDGNELTITPDDEDTDPFTVTYEVDGDTLTLNLSNATIRAILGEAEDETEDLTAAQLAMLQSLTGRLVFARQ